MNKHKRGEAMRQKNEQDVQKRLALIERILERMKKSGIKPKNLTTISEYVADEVSEKEGTACSAVTLRRNTLYRDCLDKFMTDMGYEEAPVPQVQDSKLLLQLQIRDLQKANQALEKENKTLETTLSSAYANQAQLEHILHDAKIEKVDSDRPSPLDEAVYFGIVLKLLNQLEIDHIDTVNGMVVDPVYERTLFDKAELPRFFEWYKEQQKQ